MAKKAAAPKKVPAALRNIAASFSTRVMNAVTVTSPVPMGAASVYTFGGTLVTAVSLTIDTTPTPFSVNIDIVSDPPAAPHPQNPNPATTTSVQGMVMGMGGGGGPMVYSAPIVVPAGTMAFAPLLVRIWIPVGPGRFALNVIPITAQFVP